MTEIQEAIEIEIKKLNDELKAKKKALRALKPPGRKPGRRKGQTGVVCIKLRYDVKKIDDEGVETHIGQYSTLTEVAEALNVSYKTAYQTYHKDNKLSNKVIVTSI